MMATHSNVTMMNMYEDESVDVCYGDGSQIHLSPCASEFILIKARDPCAHPLQIPEKVRQRTRFAISSYKELIVDALVFRNRCATRPYLPEELIPPVHKKPFFSIDNDVEWPLFSACDAELGPNGETIIRSVEGKAILKLSSSGEDFSVEFNCRLSQAQNHSHKDPDAKHHLPSCRLDQSGKAGWLLTEDATKQAQEREPRKNEPSRSKSCSPQTMTHRAVSSKPEEMYQSTTVVQHHSCSCVSTHWRHPLSLALHHWASHQSRPPRDMGAKGGGDCIQTYRNIDMADVSSEGRWSCLPEALPLRCHSPHLHRWKVKEPAVQGEDHSEADIPREMIKVLWCHGVIYRVIGGAISVVEVSPGDGSVIRSNGVLNSYFTHYRNEPHSREVKEVTYHVKSLPPDVPGQVYSVGSIVSRASRILTCYNQAVHSLNLPATPSCLTQVNSLSEPETFEEKQIDQHGIVTQGVLNGSDLVAEELEKIKRFNFLLENSHLPRSTKYHPEAKGSSKKENTHIEPVNESSVAEALQRTSKAIEDIDTLISATTLT